MSVKFNKREQLEIIDQIRYGGDWAKIKKNILPYDYTWG